MNLFNLFKKKEPPRQGGAINAVNALSDAMQKFADNFMYGVPVGEKQIKNDADMKHIDIFVLYSDATKYEKDQVIAVSKQMDRVLSWIYSNIDTNYFYIVSKDIKNSFNTMSNCDIIIDMGSCGEKARMLLDSAKIMNKKIITDKELEGAILFINNLKRAIDSLK